MHPRSRAIFDKACQIWHPQLVVMTGDNVDCAHSRLLFESTILPIARMFTENQVPFALTMGNHDTQFWGEGWYQGAEQWALWSRAGGRYFVEDVAGECRRFAETSELADHTRFLHMTVMNGKNLAPKTASFISESGVCFADIGAQSYLFSTNWNLAKVTRRGVDATAEWCRIDNAYRQFVIQFR